MKYRSTNLSLMMRWRTIIAAAIILIGVATPRTWATPGNRDVLIRRVPHVAQKADFCGEACAAMALQHLGYLYDQDAVYDQSGLSPEEGRGCYTRELARALANIGFDTGPVWHHVRADRADRELATHWRALLADLVNGIPSIVCTRYDERPKTTEHFRLVLGYDAAENQVIYHEPAEADGAYRRMSLAEFLRLWPLKYDAKTWTVIRMRLKPDDIRQPAHATGLTDADYAQHMLQLKKKIPNKSFHVVIERPFVVIGDESADMVRRRASGTIRWSVQKLKDDFFAKDPHDIIDIWLFKNKDSYQKHTRDIFGDTPTTPYGYYSPTHRALIMNISTGGGTLVHEIVHPFIASNFPDCPSWFNEGLASLYEQCGERDGKIIGQTNWRLPGLQRAIRARGVPSFETLCGTTTREFYHDERGTNYGQARYLCYYLQEQGKLREFYRNFRAAAGQDPTGLATLAAVLDQDDMKVFQKHWEAYVLGLSYR